MQIGDTDLRRDRLRLRAHGWLTAAISALGHGRVLCAKAEIECVLHVGPVLADGAVRRRLPAGPLVFQPAIVVKVHDEKEDPAADDHGAAQEEEVLVVIEDIHQQPWEGIRNGI